MAASDSHLPHLSPDHIILPEDMQDAGPDIFRFTEYVTKGGTRHEWALQKGDDGSIVKKGVMGTLHVNIEKADPDWKPRNEVLSVFRKDDNVKSQQVSYVKSQQVSYRLAKPFNDEEVRRASEVRKQVQTSGLSHTSEVSKHLAFLEDVLGCYWKWYQSHGLSFPDLPGESAARPEAEEKEVSKASLHKDPHYVTEVIGNELKQLKDEDRLSFETKKAFLNWAAELAKISSSSVRNYLKLTECYVKGKQGAKGVGLQETIERCISFAENKQADRKQ